MSRRSEKATEKVVDGAVLTAHLPTTACASSFPDAGFSFFLALLFTYIARVKYKCHCWS